MHAKSWFNIRPREGRQHSWQVQSCWDTNKQMYFGRLCFTFLFNQNVNSGCVDGVDFFLQMQGFATRNICWTFGAYGFGSLVVHEKSPYFREIQLGEMPIDSDNCPLPFPKKFGYFVSFLLEEIFFWFMEPLSSKLLESRALLSKRISPSGFPQIGMLVAFRYPGLKRSAIQNLGKI